MDFLEKRYTAEDVNMFCMQPLVPPVPWQIVALIGEGRRLGW